MLLVLTVVADCGPPDAPADTGSAAPTGSPKGTGESTPEAPETGLWGCAMCPAVQSRTSGRCPECGMVLVVRHGTGAFVCIEHAEHGAMDLEPGTCRRCGRPYEAALTRLVYRCATHEQVLADAKGSCAVCGAEMRAQRMALMWECDEHGLVSLDGGGCPRCGRELLESLVALPHGDHSPRHGGLFFMAPDRWHHLEGALVANDTFRLYLYDNFTRPMGTGGVSGFVQVGRITQDGDVELAETRHPLRPVPDTNYFEVTSRELRPPLDLALSLYLFGGDGDPDRFDFTFTGLSKDPAEASGGDSPRTDIRVEIPGTLQEVLAAIDERREEVRRHLEARRLDLLYKPALEAKELTLALEAYGPDAPAAGRSELARALYETVRGAWLLDARGDLGDLAGAREAYDVFASGLDRLKAVFLPEE